MRVTEVADAVDEAKRTISQADYAIRENAHAMAKLLVGHLRHASDGTVRQNHVLRSLKKELRGFNVRTGCWD